MFDIGWWQRYVNYTFGTNRHVRLSHGRQWSTAFRFLALGLQFLLPLFILCQRHLQQRNMCTNILTSIFHISTSEITTLWQDITHTHTTILRPFFGTTRVSHPAGCHSIRTNQCPPPPSPHIFLQAGCPSCRTTNSVKALKATSAWRDINEYIIRWLSQWPIDIYMEISRDCRTCCRLHAFPNTQPRTIVFLLYCGI